MERFYGERAVSRGEQTEPRFQPTAWSKTFALEFGESNVQAVMDGDLMRSSTVARAGCPEVMAGVKDEENRSDSIPSDR